MDDKKYVDEGWKESVAKEKESTHPQNEGTSPSQQPSASEDLSPEAEDLAVNFINYISGLVFQTMISLGEIPNPLAGQKVERNLKQAKFMIDTLILLREKTRGNLTKEEEEFLNAALYELQLKYVEYSKGAL